MPFKSKFLNNDNCAWKEGSKNSCFPWNFHEKNQGILICQCMNSSRLLGPFNYFVFFLNHFFPNKLRWVGLFCVRKKLFVILSHFMYFNNLWEICNKGFRPHRLVTFLTSARTSNRETQLILDHVFQAITSKYTNVDQLSSTDTLHRITISMYGLLDHGK